MSALKYPHQFFFRGAKMSIAPAGKLLSEKNHTVCYVTITVFIVRGIKGVILKVELLFSIQFLYVLWQNVHL
jgi:hypothetical protein